jgi:hypothetical protein
MYFSASPCVLHTPFFHSSTVMIEMLLWFDLFIPLLTSRCVVYFVYLKTEVPDFSAFRLVIGAVRLGKKIIQKHFVSNAYVSKYHHVLVQVFSTTGPKTFTVWHAILSSVSSDIIFHSPVFLYHVFIIIIHLKPSRNKYASCIWSIVLIFFSVWH